MRGEGRDSQAVRARDSQAVLARASQAIRARLVGSLCEILAGRAQTVVPYVEEGVDVDVLAGIHNGISLKS